MCRGFKSHKVVFLHKNLKSPATFYKEGAKLKKDLNPEQLVEIRNMLTQLSCGRGLLPEFCSGLYHKFDYGPVLSTREAG